MTQALALEILKRGESVFLTGPAGSGKTFVLNQFTDTVNQAAKQKIALTASTGLAATHLGGGTIHSWSGIGIRKELPANFLTTIPPIKRRLIEETDILVIDEVSMLADYHLNMIDTICRRLRRSQLPFGGLQVVFCGDFYQLPPVKEVAEQLQLAAYSQAWRQLGPVICYLQEQYRQTDDGLLTILNALRHGRLTTEHIKQLRSRLTAAPPGDITQLYCHNRNVDTVNQAYLDKIKGRLREFPGEGDGQERRLTELKNRCLAPENLGLKRGSWVMFVANDPRRQYVNGTCGRVVGFMTSTGYPVVETASGRKITAEPFTWRAYGPDGQTPVAHWRQIPLRLAWAITVHKSQGMTLSRAHIDLSEAFSPNMGYVALSRVRGLSNLTLAGFNQTALTMDQQVIVLDQQLRAASSQASQDFGHLV